MLTSREWKIFLSSIVMTGIFILFFVARYGLTVPPQGLNSDGYWQLAEGLYRHHTFTSILPPHLPEATHVPGYPLFLAIVAVPFHSPIPALLIQAFLLGLSAVFLYRLTDGIFSEKVRFYSALLFGIEPFTALTAASPLTEALFLFLLVGSLLVCRRAWEGESVSLWGFGGLLLGAGILVRPILMYMIPILALFAWMMLAGRSFLGRSRVVAVFLLCALLLPGMWMVRNHALFDTWIISNKGPFTLYAYDVSELIVARDGITSGEANRILLEKAQETYSDIQSLDELRDPRYAPFLTRTSAMYIAENFSLYTKIHATTLATFFFSDGYRLLLSESGLYSPPLPNITRALLRGEVGVVLRGLVATPLSLLLLVFGTLFWFTMFVLAFWASLNTLFKKENRSRLFTILLFVAFIGYFAMLTGPVAQARYRIMITPFLFPLALFGAELLRNAYRSRARHNDTHHAQQ